MLVAVLFAFALLSPKAAAQQDKPSKFNEAPPGAKNVRSDIYTISFVKDLKEEDFERELERILKQYDAELANLADFGPDAKVKIPSIRWAVLYVPEDRARQIAEDGLVAEVAQVFEIVPIIEKTVPVPGPPLGPGKHWPPGKKPSP